MGGGMRQAGYLAAAGFFALKNHIPQLKKDNDKAKQLGEVLSTLSWVTKIEDIKTNIVIFDIDKNINTSTLLQNLKEAGINASAFWATFD